MTIVNKELSAAVLSGDTLVLRGRPGPQGQPPKERSARPYTYYVLDRH